MDVKNLIVRGAARFVGKVYGVSQDIQTTIATSAWAADSTTGGSIATITGIAGLEASDRPSIDLITSTTASTAATQEKEFNKIYHATVTATGTLKLYAKSAPTSALTIVLKIVR